MRKQSIIIVAAAAVSLTLTTHTLIADQEGPGSGQGIVFKDARSSPGTVRLTKLLGTDARDPQAKGVGKIKEVVFNAAGDRTSYIVVAQPEGLNQKLIALPYKAMKYGSPGEDRVYLSVNRDILEKAPGFTESKWPTEVTADYFRSLDAYYGTQLAAMVDPPTPAAVSSASAQPAAGQISVGQQGQWSRRASKLQGRDIISPTGESLGKISDIVLDQSSGEVLYAAFEDNRGKFHAAPLSAFTPDLNDKKLMLNTTRDELKQMPAFDEDRWPAKADPRWSKQAPGQ